MPPIAIQGFNSRPKLPPPFKLCPVDTMSWFYVMTRDQADLSARPRSPTVIPARLSTKAEVADVVFI